MPARRLDPAVIRAAKGYLEQGYTQHAAARTCGISQSALSTALRRALKDEPLISDKATPDFVEIPVIHRDYRDRDRLYLYPLGDVHLGAPAHDAAKWQQWLDYVEANDECSVILTGDLLNSAIKTSVSDVYEETSPVGQAKRAMRKQLEPLKDRIDLAIPGNHEHRIWNAVGDCPIHDIADFLGIPYARDAAVLIYHVGEVDYQVMVRHGTGNGQVGARAGRLQKQAQTCLADVYISGHTHSRLAFPEEILAYDPELDRMVRRDRYFVSSGSFLRLESYAVKAGFAPTKLGAPRLFLSGTERDIHVSV